MSRRDLIKSCQINNKSERNVFENGSTSLREFWRNTDGNFMISGNKPGAEYDRMLTLSGAICHNRNMYDGAVIVLTSDSYTTEQIIRLASSRELKRKIEVIPSKKYKYDPLFGIGKESASRCIEAVANYKAIANGEFYGYVDAITELIDFLGNPVCLNVIHQLVEMTAEEIWRFAYENGASDIIMSKLSRYSSAHTCFVGIIREMMEAFSCISSKEVESEYNIKTAVDDRKMCVIEVDDTVDNLNVIRNIVFMTELSDAIKSRNNVTVILSNIKVDESFLKYLLNCSEKIGFTLGINNPDVKNIFKSDNDLVNCFQTRVIFNHAINALTERYLKDFGRYLHREVIDGPKWIKTRRLQLIKEKEAHIETRERDRVLVKELQYAAIYGHRGKTVELINRWED